MSSSFIHLLLLLLYLCYDVVWNVPYLWCEEKNVDLFTFKGEKSCHTVTRRAVTHKVYQRNHWFGTLLWLFFEFLKKNTKMPLNAHAAVKSYYYDHFSGSHYKWSILFSETFSFLCKIPFFCSYIIVYKKPF